jgi:preprotein translocase subunit SecA
LQQALKAQALFKRDKDYVVTKDGEVVIVDEFTGRLLPGRRYNEGLHQAIEAKESVPVLQESMTLATISFQNYFRLYKKLSGMTGTAYTEAEEFQQIYGLDVVQIPSNKPLAREDKSDMIFKTEAGKIAAIVKQVKEYQKIGRPVLLGSASIEKNEALSQALTKAGVKHETLNAKNNEREAAIVAKAGEKGAVTLATNIAGRGTDIVLGKGVKELGGLVVIGSERHESRRIDNQLRGRCGRQGDPGLTQFYVSTEDDLMRIFQGERIRSLMDRLGVDEDTAIQNKAVSKTLEAAQKRVEGYNYDTRKNVVQYDNVINRHRRVVYVMRRKILEGDNIKPEIQRLIDEKLRELTVVPAKNNRNFAEQFETVFPAKAKTIEEIGAEKKDKARFELAQKAIEKLYAAKEKELGEDVIRKVEREVYLQVLDTLWMQHLENMQHLREGIHWRSVGQRDPLVEYRSESQNLFNNLQAMLRDEVLRSVMHVHVHDVIASQAEDYDTELTRLAENAVEKGVNEITGGEENRDDDFKAKKAKSASELNRQKNVVRKKKKAQRQNRKTNRK